MGKEVVTMFIRWQKKGNKKYGHLEERKRVEGKVVTHYISYIGAVEKTPQKLLNLLETGVIDTEQYNTLCSSIPKPEIQESVPDLVSSIKAEIDALTEDAIMKEFPHMSAHFAHLDGVRYMLKKIENIKRKYPEIWES